ncbi:hypothetical protein HPB47_021877 [Ixodes persulcatus]|uniref:Uncharacterized protein n=1 Tax=Ixodes persulcatus TaxID=34615 RepID=A0AC60QBA7_IXOPE|nr:hypothetical protein HPB47_021877 [Ixodes persulcatus]
MNNNSVPSPEKPPPTMKLRWQGPKGKKPHTAGRARHLGPTSARPAADVEVLTGMTTDEVARSLQVSQAPEFLQESLEDLTQDNFGHEIPNFGSGSDKNSISSVLAAKTGFVVLSINCRLGILGFFNANFPDAPGNQRLLDQNLAVKWVHDSIEAFGGDPSMVTIFRDSAGGISIHSHILSPMSQGFIKRAVMMSGLIWAECHGEFETDGSSEDVGTQETK